MRLPARSVGDPDHTDTVTSITAISVSAITYPL
jgi:hypothetical protein